MASGFLGTQKDPTESFRAGARVTKSQVAQEGNRVSRQLEGRGVRPGAAVVSASPGLSRAFFCHQRHLQGSGLKIQICILLYISQHMEFTHP